MHDAQEVTRQELSTKEASRISGLSRNHITLLLRQGKLEGRNFAHRLWTVYADSLERYMATSHKPGPKGPRKNVRLETSDTASASAAPHQGSA
jgi:hypothetical protein